MRAPFFYLAACALVLQGAQSLQGQGINVQSTPADLARWMYPFNGMPNDRPTASAFGALGNTPDFDSRDAQYLLAWNTSNSIPAGMGPTNYLLRQVRLTLTISRDMAYAYSGTLRDYRTYFPTNDPRYLAPADPNCPTELFGAGFRGGHTAMTFQQGTSWFADPSAGFHTNRTAYAAGFDTNGALVDVSNNIADDGTNEIANPFEVAPFAVGISSNVAPGQLMPEGSRLTFHINLSDPLIYGYLQQSLHDGRLFFVVTCLVGASLGGQPNYPDFYTIFSALADPEDFPVLDISGTVVRNNIDTDTDGLPDDWEQFHFNSLSADADDDSDDDGARNVNELRAGTDPAASADVFRLLSVRREPDGTELRFSSAPNRRYSIEWSDDLQNWQSVTNPAIVYSSAWLSKSEPNPSYPSPVFATWRDLNPTSQARFYRIGVE